MKHRKFTYQITALFLVCALTLPPGPTRPMAGAGSPVYALRPVNAGMEESSVHQELRDRFGLSSAGLEEKERDRDWRKPAAAGTMVAAVALAAGGLALGASQKPETPQLPPQRPSVVSQPAPRGQGASQTISSFLKNPEALIHLSLADLRVKRPQHFYWFQLNKALFQWLEFERQEDFQRAFAGINSFLARHRGSYPLPPGAYSLEFLASYFSQAPSGSLTQFEQEFLSGLRSRALLSDRWENFSGKGPKPLPRYIPPGMDMVSVRVITKPVVIGAGWQMNLQGKPVDRKKRAKRVRAAWRFYTHQQVHLTTQVASEQSLIGIKLKPDRDFGWFHVKRTKQGTKLYWLEFQWEQEYRETFARIQKFAESHREGDLASSDLYSFQLLADYFSKVPRYKQDLSEGQRFTLSYLEVALLEHLRVRRLLLQRRKRWVATEEAILGIGWQRDTQGKPVNPKARMFHIDSALQRYRSRRPSRAGLEEKVVTLEQVKSASSWEDIFGNDRPVVLEIGPDVSPERAWWAQGRGLNVLAVEKSPGIFQNGTVIASFPEDARLLQADIRDLLRDLPDGLRSFQEVYVDYPSLSQNDPAGPPFILEQGCIQDLLRSLSPGGSFILRTVSREVTDTAFSMIGAMDIGGSFERAHAIRYEDQPDTAWSGHYEKSGVPTHLLIYQRPTGLEERGRARLEEIRSTAPSV